jgi:hypothetical protein
MYGSAEDYKGDIIDVSNHTMFTWNASCGQDGCHPNADAAWAGMRAIQTSYQGVYDQADAKFTAAQEAFEAANMTAGADEALIELAKIKLEELDEYWHDIGLQGSLGFHNPDGMQEDLEDFMQECDEVIKLSEDAKKPTMTDTTTETTMVSELSLQLLAIFSLSIALVVAVLRRRRVA